MVGYEIFDTYKAYKAKEKQITSWLKETVQKLSPASAKKSTSDSNNIPINKIPIIVEYIVSRGQSIPDRLHQVLRDLITQRKEASAFYKTKGAADSGHTHYIGVLEKALKAFDDSKTESSASIYSIDCSGAAPGHSTSDVEFRNLFDALKIDDAVNNGGEKESDGESNGDRESNKENLTAKQTTRTKKSRKRNGRPQKTPKASKAAEKKTEAKDISLLDSLIADNDSYEEEVEDDLYFMIYCFFKDFNYIRE
jgi:hypothetical protein